MGSQQQTQQHTAVGSGSDSDMSATQQADRPELFRGVVDFVAPATFLQVMDGSSSVKHGRKPDTPSSTPTPQYSPIRHPEVIGDPSLTQLPPPGYIFVLDMGASARESGKSL